MSVLYPCPGCHRIRNADEGHRLCRECEGYTPLLAAGGGQGSMVNEFVCEECMDGDHDACRREGGWPHQDTNERCGCHLSDHALDNRAALSTEDPDE